MAGHSHWARIKRGKAVVDARRGRAWSKLARAVIMAARGGGDPEANLALRYAIDAAKAANMPKDTIERAIKKGTGELAGESIEELVYEGYGPGGAAVMLKVLTDNRNRTAGEIRNLFERHGGNLGSTNSVAWMFSSRGVFVVSSRAATEERLTELALEAGADDVRQEGDSCAISCEPAAYDRVRRSLAAAGIECESAELTMAPSATVQLAGADAERMLKLYDALEEHDDVQNVYSNFEVSDEEMARLT
jgi:YebC/PmpR family DNA-binding regulatory protein